MDNFNYENFLSSLTMLQPVTPTDDKHQAHWWNENPGKIIRVQQEVWITRAKTAMKDFRSKKEINEIIDQIYKPDLSSWPIVGNSRVNKKFWEKGFGLKIRLEWYTMFDQWIDYINSLLGKDF